MNKSILFVCTGNMCRSPMAEYMLRARLPQGSAWTVGSAGTMGGNGMGASTNSVDVLQEIGIDMSAHRTRGITPELLTDCALVVVMTESHRDEVLDVLPTITEKIFLMRSFDPQADTRDVPDPVGWDIDVYRGTREMLNSAMPGLLDFMAQLEGE